MEHEQFKRCLVAAFGPGFLMPAAQALEVSFQRMQRMVRGLEPIYPATAAKVKELLREKRNQVDTIMREIGA